jgi:hypothetical protein
MKKQAQNPIKSILMIAILLFAASMSASDAKPVKHATNQDPGMSCELRMWYLDSDGDGLGDMLNAQMGCTQPYRYVSNCLDLDDTDDCIGNVCEVEFIREWYKDADGDGFGDAFTVVISSKRPEGYVLDSTDANDLNATIWFELNDEIQIAQNKE